MSATATVPPPSSSSMLRRVPRLTARARALLTAVNLHYAGVAALLVIVLYMVAHLLFLQSHQPHSLHRSTVVSKSSPIRRAASGDAVHCLADLPASVVFSSRPRQE